MMVGASARKSNGPGPGGHGNGAKRMPRCDSSARANANPCQRCASVDCMRNGRWVAERGCARLAMGRRGHRAPSSVSWADSRIGFGRPAVNGQVYADSARDACLVDEKWRPGGNVRGRTVLRGSTSSSAAGRTGQPGDARRCAAGKLAQPNDDCQWLKHRDLPPKPCAAAADRASRSAGGRVDACDALV